MRGTASEPRHGADSPRGGPRPQRLAWLAAALCAGAAAAAIPEASLVQLFDRLSCGGSQVTARAACHHDARRCVRETLTFHRPEGTTVVAPHQRLARQPAADGGSLDALEYRASAWACVPGANGGRFLVVVMESNSGAGCAMCEYVRLYHPNGRLIASTLRFDRGENPRPDAAAGELIREMIGSHRPGALRPVYGK